MRSTTGTEENEKKDSETASCCKTLVTHSSRQRSTCENDVGDVAMVTVALLLLLVVLLVWQAAVAAAQAHHELLGVVEGGGLVVQAVGADGCFHHVELLQLSIATEEDICCCGNKHCVTPGTLANGALVSPAATERWPGWMRAAGRRSPQTRCPVWSCAETKHPNQLQGLRWIKFYVEYRLYS